MKEFLGQGIARYCELTNTAPTELKRVKTPYLYETGPGFRPGKDTAKPNLVRSAIPTSQECEVDVPLAPGEPEPAEWGNGMLV